MRKLSLWCLHRKSNIKQQTESDFGNSTRCTCWHFTWLFGMGHRILVLGVSLSICFYHFSICFQIHGLPGFYLPMRSRSARRSITCRLKIMRATELPSRIGGCMAQHGAWCNRSSVWSKHGTLKAFQHTSLEQGIFGNRTGMELLQTDVAWCGAKFDPRKSEVAAALWQMAFRRSPLWVAASSHMSCIMLYQFLNQVVSSGKCNMQIICNKLPVLWRAKYILPQEKW